MRSLGPGDPERIGDYRLLGRLGEGGMGRVYLAQSPRGRTVAVKLVRPDLAAHEEFRSRFEREVAAARRVGGEWTAPVLDADTGADEPWVATGYIPGISLHEAVAGREEALPERTLRILANRLALALGAVHEAGLVHRDVKPSNILVTIDGPRVIDFGIARALETVAGAHVTRTGAVVGSPGFMSPEQVRGERLTSASDVFSLGSVLAFAALRRTPFGGEDTAGHVLMYRIAQEEPDIEGVPEELRALIAGCLAKDADARPALAEILARTADPEDEPGPTSPDAEAAEPWLPAGLVAQLGRHAAR
ncbi:serine/threonine-protein kinase, partial [Streptomyces albiaxialis]|uniref:serine/threonine-protein kinase n=1 Tax=Streptomyces albiaxialis TaxID=329523 RepID=UPI0031E1DC9A